MICLDFIITLLAIVGGVVVINFFYRGYRGSRKFKYMNDLIRRYEEDSTPEASVDRLIHSKPSFIDTIPTDIYKWCMSHSPERNICARYNAKEEDFHEIFMTLCIACPLTIKGFFVPISAFFFYSSLNYILKNKDNLNSRQTLNDLYAYFERQ